MVPRLKILSKVSQYSQHLNMSTGFLSSHAFKRKFIHEDKIITNGLWVYLKICCLYCHLWISYHILLIIDLFEIKVHFRNKNLIVIFKLCCLKMHRVLGINKGKNNCNFEKERCVIFFQSRRGYCWRRFSKKFNCFSIQSIWNISLFKNYLIFHNPY